MCSLPSLWLQYLTTIIIQWGFYGSIAMGTLISRILPIFPLVVRCDAVGSSCWGLGCKGRWCTRRGYCWYLSQFSLQRSDHMISRTATNSLQTMNDGGARLIIMRIIILYGIYIMHLSIKSPTIPLEAFQADEGLWQENWWKAPPLGWGHLTWPVKHVASLWMIV